MREDVIVTHIPTTRPDPQGAIPLFAICNTEDKSMYFLQGSEDHLISQAQIDSLESTGEIIRLARNVRIKVTEQFFLHPNGKFSLADSTEGPVNFNGVYSDILNSSKQHCILRSSDIEILLDVGITAADLLVDDFPEEFKKTLQELETYIGNERNEALDQCSHELLRCKKFNYTEIDDGLQGLQSRVEFVLSQAGKKTIQEHPHDSVEMMIQKRKDITPTIFTFPFFMIGSLSQFWGLIPYGYQTKMGIIISKNSDYWLELERPNWGSVVKCEKVIEKIFKVIDKTDSAKIHICRGYIFEEVADKIFNNFIREKKLSKMTFLNFHKHKEYHDSADFNSNSFRNWLMSRTSPKYRNSIVFVDPGEIHNISQNDNRDLIYVSFEHGLHIPLGIGFSLSAFPYILKGQKWRQARAAVDQEFSKLDIEQIEKLHSLGVTLNLNVLPQTRFNLYTTSRKEHLSIRQQNKK